MITNRGTLQTSIRNWLLRDASDLVLTTDQINECIQLAESELNRELRIRSLEATVSLTIAAGTNYADLPSDFNAPKEILFASSPYEPTYYATRKAMLENEASTGGRPVAYTIIGKRLVFNVASSSALNLNLDYFKKIPALTDAVPVNDILLEYPDLYLYGAQKHAMTQSMDKDRLEVAGTIFSGAIDRVLKADQESIIPSGVSLKPRNRGMF